MENDNSQICDVWQSNIYTEFEHIRNVVQSFPYIAMDTEFPGVVAKPIGNFRTSSEFTYQLIRCNVDMLKLIQLGLSFMNERGESPVGISTWQFNFKFDLSMDMYAADSIELLRLSGIQFNRHEQDGIDPNLFADLLLTSGIVLMDNVKWLSFHAGYDFCYLLKILTNSKLPEEESTFFHLLRDFFPIIFDVKHLMRSCHSLKGGLQEVSDQLSITRIGMAHQAGSDALLTGMLFFKMRDQFFQSHIDEQKYSGHLYGLVDTTTLDSFMSHSNLAARVSE